jgi:hypothetical protein
VNPRQQVVIDSSLIKCLLIASVYDTGAPHGLKGASVFGDRFLGEFVGSLISLFRMFAGKLRARRSSDWRATTATVAGASCQISSFLPRTVAEIVYTYRIDGGFYGGVDEKPFFLSTSAEEYAKQFAVGDNLVVRIKPGAPEVSIVCEQHIVRPNHPPANVST